MLKKGLILIFSTVGIGFLVIGIDSFITLKNIQSNSDGSAGLGEFAYWGGGWISVTLSAVFFLSALLLYIFKKPKKTL